MRATEMAIVGIVVLSFVIAAYFYPSFPDMIPSHWDANGQVNGYMPKLTGLFLMPIIGLLMALLFFAIPKIDPLRFNIEKFRAQYDNFVLLVMIFLLYLFFLTIAWTMGARFKMLQALAPAFAILFYYAGVLMERSKMNWFVGMRTPWTLSSENVWNKTNVLAAKLFKISAVIAIIAIVIPAYAFALVIAPVILFTIYLFIYSYQEYQKEPKKVSKGRSIGKSQARVSAGKKRRK